MSFWRPSLDSTGASLTMSAADRLSPEGLVSVALGMESPFAAVVWGALPMAPSNPSLKTFAGVPRLAARASPGDSGEAGRVLAAEVNGLGASRFLAADEDRLRALSLDMAFHPVQYRGGAW